MLLVKYKFIMFTPHVEFLLFYYSFIIFTFILPFPLKSIVLASLYLLSFAKYYPDILELPRWCRGKEFVCQCRRHRRYEFDPWVGKIPLEEEMATHFNILAWEIWWIEESDGLQSMSLQKSQTWLSIHHIVFLSESYHY